MVQLEAPLHDRLSDIASHKTVNGTNVLSGDLIQ